MNKINKNIALFFVAQTISLLGSMIVFYAVLWHITLITKSGFMMSMVSLAGALPLFFISPLAGAWADRYNKKLLINLADAGIALATLIMSILFSLNIKSMFLLIIILAIRAFGQGIQTPAVSALISDLVPKEELIKVNAINGTMQSIILFLSPILASIIFASLPMNFILLIDVISAVIAIFITFFLVKVKYVKNDIQEKKLSVVEDIKEGIKYIRSIAFLKKFFLLMAIIDLFVGPFAIMTPLQMVRNFGENTWKIFSVIEFTNAHRLAIIDTAFFLGMLVAGIIMSFWGGFKNKAYTLALSNFICGIFGIFLVIPRNFIIYTFAMFFTGIGVGIFSSPSQSILQINVDKKYMGRVFSVYTMISNLMLPLGTLFWGPLGDIISIDYLIIICSVVIFITAFPFIVDKDLKKAGV